tara:strand:+ start:663 stop:1535 length:873 start_codon:yes stop_codon:yes gene_type:complete
MITHEDLIEIISLPMLVYDYAKKFKLDKNQTIEGFLGSVKKGDEELELTEVRKEVLMNILSYAPQGEVVDFINDNDTDLQVAITKSEKKKRITVVFRGSESKTDWYYDLQIRKMKLHDDVYVHSGFHRQLHINNNYEKIRDCVKNLLNENKEYEIFVTGHSLGAALSTLFGYELSREIDSNIIVISFASPRVGNYNWRKAFDNKSNLAHYRVTNNRDIVTASPMILYNHVGINIHLKPSSYDIFENYSYNTWWKYSLFNCWSANDHNIDLYYKNLKNNPWDKDSLMLNQD